MKLLNAWTMELDEPAVAVSEILEQLDLANNALKYSVGLATCGYDFVETGMFKPICDALPFDVIGCTTLTNANNERSGTMLFCLTVLTADDCQFAATVTNSLVGDSDGEIDKAVQKAISAIGQKANMAIALMPMYGIGGEIMLNALDTSLDGTPVFGTVACGYDTAAYDDTYIIYNGECFRDCLSLILISGNVNPKFVVLSTSEQNLSRQQAVITSSEKCLLKEVNGMSALKFFESIGLMIGKGIEGMCSIPFVVDYGDGTQPIARAIYGLSDDGSAVCGGIMPEGGSLCIGKMDIKDILDTAEGATKKLLGFDDINGLIMFPCLGRNMIIAMDPMAEINVVRNLVGKQTPMHLAYSAGECCPVYGNDGLVANRFHNFTFIGCAL